MHIPGTTWNYTRLLEKSAIQSYWLDLKKKEKKRNKSSEKENSCLFQIK